MFVIVAGAGLIGREITQVLVRNKHDVVVIDLDREVCESMHAETGALTIHGSATDLRILEEAGALKADVVICLMRSDADNISTALLSKSLGVPRVIARLRNPRYEHAYQLAGVTSVVRMAELILNQIVMEVEQPRVKKIMTLGGGKAEIYAVKIPKSARTIGMAIKDIAQDKSFPSECVFMGIYQEENDDFLIPRGNHVLQQGDTIFLVSKSQYVKQATDYLTKG